MFSRLRLAAKYIKVSRKYYYFTTRCRKVKILLLTPDDRILSSLYSLPFQHEYHIAGTLQITNNLFSIHLSFPHKIFLNG